MTPKPILRFLLTLLLLFLAGELFLRTAFVETPATTDFSPGIGRIKRPGMPYVFFNEGFSIGNLNSYGYLGLDYGYEKPDSVQRIALVGDSYVESFQVFERHHFRNLMEKSLNENSDREYQILNFGRSGFNLADMYAYYQNFVLTFQPDLTLFFISYEDLQPEQTDPLIPKVRITNDTVFVDNHSYPEAYLNNYIRYRFLTMHFSSMQMLNNSVKLIRKGFLLPKLLGKFYTLFQQPARTKTTMPSTDPLERNQAPTEIPSPQVNELAQAIFNTLSQTPGVLIVNRGENPLPDYVLDILARHNLPYLDLNDTLNILRHQGTDPGYWEFTKKSGHWNHAGHQAVAEFLADRIAGMETPCGR